MQTFLPYQHFHHSADALDNKRLGKQRVEALQILQTLLKPPYTCKNCGLASTSKQDSSNCNTAKAHKFYATPWSNHPAVRMWRAHKIWLYEYGVAICEIWIKRGFADTVKAKFDDILKSGILNSEAPFPAWLTPEFCRAHQSNLIRKDSAFYRPLFGNDVPDDLPYIWPV